MKICLNIGVFALQGDVAEHVVATKKAAANAKIKCSVVEARTYGDLASLDGLIIPGGESTVLYKLCEREGIFHGIKSIKNIFGTCAGAIMLAKKIRNEGEGQKTLELMDIEIDRNAYGRQAESFESNIEGEGGFGKIHAVFIRAPKITSMWGSVKALVKDGKQVVACEQRALNGNYYLAACFHPELSTTLFHERFLKNIK